MTRPVHIFAIGGGGFSNPEDNRPDDRLLEDCLLALAGPVSHLKIGYIGHASNDDPLRITAFHNRFHSCASTKILRLDATVDAAREFLATLDIVYVGGGRTTMMLDHWRKTGIADALLAATDEGLILSGVSAGAICWFSELLLGTAEDGYDLYPGLGLLAGSACPHYRNEPPRRAAYDNRIAAGHLAAGLAIDDGVAVHIADGVAIDIVRARGESGNAYYVAPGTDGVEMHVLQPGHHLAMTIPGNDNSGRRDRPGSRTGHCSGAIGTKAGSDGKAHTGIAEYWNCRILDLFAVTDNRVSFKRIYHRVSQLARLTCHEFDTARDNANVICQRLLDRPHSHATRGSEHAG